MHELLAAGLAVLGLSDQVPALTDASNTSNQNLNAASRWLLEKVPPDNLDNVDVVVLGSYARGEASGESDFDYLVIPYGLTPLKKTRELISATDEFITSILEGAGAGPLKRPGRTGLFGTITAAPDMAERIGLENDTNLSHSRRVLLIEESKSIYRPDLHAQLLRSIFERYLADYDNLTKAGPPRFLINDVVRYWYTLAVDYQAKRWEGNNTDWGLRYLKLLNSRRLSYAGALIPLLLCDPETPVTTDYLLQQFQLPPLARIAQLALDRRFECRQALRDVFLAAEAFAAFLADGDAREAAKAVVAVSDPQEAFTMMRKNADQLGVALKTVFFESFLRVRSVEYLVF